MADKIKAVIRESGYTCDVCGTVTSEAVVWFLEKFDSWDDFLDTYLGIGSEIIIKAQDGKIVLERIKE